IGLQLILSLSILVVLHEYGHFATARWFGMRVEKFYLFFDFFGWKLWKNKKGDTEYGIGWCPLGGYVKIAGMIDESMDTEQMKQPPQPWEYRSKPAWQRLIVILGGVIVNFLLGFFIWSMLLFVWGEERIPMQQLEGGIRTGELAQQMGLKDGDVILEVGDQPFQYLDNETLLKGIVFAESPDKRTIKVRRDGATQVLVVSDSAKQALTSSRKKKALIAPRYPFIIQEVAKEPAKSAGFKVGDRIVGIGTDTSVWTMDIKKQLKENSGKETIFIVQRDGQYQNISAKVSETGTLGVMLERPPMEKVKYGFFESFPEGTSKSLSFLGMQISAFGQMFSGEIKAQDTLGGFGSIAGLFSAEWNWYQFWRITAILSLILAFMNLLPIPVLDGGHALFILIEMIIRRPLPEKFLTVVQNIGFLILIGLLLYANGLDIYRAFAN
ncbi:MAG: RIP metalloprotease RseP, partial [Saprospiraceae bacterium]|nr:RIP metalloprotease RseP [Saprospiraceae bacterium]